ncbi:MAG: hypothetical protein KME49_25720 [Brasilonema octagenarum HA4186-MV1]|jgi:predicted DNA-binding protein|nr:hypothetical protein [Brasilonema octagenarum HA4186-MV1]
MATTKTISFRCPDEMLEFIEQQAQKTGAEKTAVIMKLLEAGRGVLGENLGTAIHPTDTVRQMIEEALVPLQAQLDELRGKLKA